MQIITNIYRYGTAPVKLASAKCCFKWGLKKTTTSSQLAFQSEKNCSKPFSVGLQAGGPMPRTPLSSLLFKSTCGYTCVT